MSGYTLNNPLHFFRQLLFENYIEKLCNDYENDKDYIVDFGLANEFKKTKVDTVEKYMEFFLSHLRTKSFEKINSDMVSLIAPHNEVYLSELEATLKMYKSKIKSLDKFKEIITNELLLIEEYLNVNYSLILEEIEAKKNTEFYFAANTSELPFKFFDTLIFKDGYDRLRQSFYFKTIHTKDYRFLSEYNQEFTFEAWLMKADISEQLHFDAYIKKVLKYYADDSISLVDSVIKNSEPKAYLKNQLNTIFTLYSKIEDFKQEEYDLLSQVFFYITSTFKLKYNDLGINHKLYNLLLDEEDKPVNSGFLPLRSLSKKFFVELYEVTANKLELIDDEEVSEDAFLDVFMFESPQSDSLIKFRVSNPVAVYYLDQVTPFFENLTRVAIEKSGLFLNKQGKVFNQTDLNTASSRGAVKSELKIRINNSIDELKNKYLK